jgi:hypothetical protein
MFPPMNPHGERVRAELENQQIEWEASFRANFADNHILSVFHRAIVKLFQRRPSVQASREPARKTSYSYADEHGNC